MQIINLSKHNIDRLNIAVSNNEATGISGLSGSGKTTFCSAIAQEYQRRLVSLLPKSDRDFLYKDLSKTDFGALDIADLPAIKFFHQDSVVLTPRSTVGTHTGIFKSIRKLFAEQYQRGTQFFSFNNLNEANEHLICSKCKGRGTFKGIKCSLCNGTRYTNAIADYPLSINGRDYTLVDIHDISIEKLLPLMKKAALPSKDILLLEAIISFELGYLSLSRTFSTLSGGETTRLQLAEAITSSEGNLIIVDELSHGLDSKTLDNILDVIADFANNNCIWMIDHSENVLRTINNKLFFGPGSGKNGGKIVEFSPRPSAIQPERHYKPNGKQLLFKDLNCRNINIKTLEMPDSAIIAITGKSGCGKSTLIRDCVLPYLFEYYSDITPLIIEQNKAKLVTRNSTISSFLNLTDELKKRAKMTKKYCPYCMGSGLSEHGTDCESCNGSGIDPQYFLASYEKGITIGDLLQLSIGELLPRLSKQSPLYYLFEKINQLGISHLSLGRSVRTLSSGEYQALYLISCLISLKKGKKYFLFLDEPTKGLSQNIINELMALLRHFQESYDITIVYIEHNNFMLDAADYVIDFGSKRLDNVTNLICLPQSKRTSSDTSTKKKGKCIPALKNNNVGIFRANSIIEGVNWYQHAQNQFFFTLRTLSDTANWIYSTYESDKDRPVIAIDFGKRLYSSHTRILELCNIVSRLVKIISPNLRIAEQFDFKSVYNHCPSCKGTGAIQTIDFNLCVKDSSLIWNKGYLQDEITSALRNYNFSRVTRMFTELKKLRGLDLSKPVGEMTKEEKMVLHYGDWNYMLPGKDNKVYVWRGLNFLIQKYMKSSNSSLKGRIKECAKEMTCPICKGRTLRHTEQLLWEGKDISYYLNLSLKDLAMVFPDIDEINNIIKIVGDDKTLMDDVSKFPQNVQATIKLYEILSCKFSHFNIYLKDIALSSKDNANIIRQIASKNAVYICSENNNDDFSNSLVESLLPLLKCKKTSFVYELFGFKDIDKKIKDIKKHHKCQSCGGSGSVAVISENEDINYLKEDCSACYGSGIDPVCHTELVEGVSVYDWINGIIHSLDNNYDLSLHIPLLKRIEELNPGELHLLELHLKKGNK